jgi:cytochrome c-type biogenesis protein
MLSDGTLALALGAGVVAALNPCGFALLPAYLSLLVLEEKPSRPAAVWRALRATAALTAGFAGVFAVFGLAVTPVASSVQEYLPGFTVVLGLVLAAAGAWVLAGHALPSLPVRRRRRGQPVTGSVASMAGYGASYAVASLGCTIAPFLAVVVTAFRAGSTTDGIVLFLAYAGGMGLVVGTMAVAVALARQGVIGRVRRAGRFLPRIAGALLLVAGSYVAWYGAWELRVLHADAGADPVVQAAARVQEWLAGNAEALGASGFLAVLVVLVGVALLARRRSDPAATRTTLPLVDPPVRTKEKS